MDNEGSTVMCFMVHIPSVLLLLVSSNNTDDVVIQSVETHGPTHYSAI